MPKSPLGPSLCEPGGLTEKILTTACLAMLLTSNTGVLPFDHQRDWNLQDQDWEKILPLHYTTKWSIFSSTAGD